MREYKDKITLEFEKLCENDPGVTPFVNFGRAILGKKLDPAILEIRMKKCLSGKLGDFTHEEALDHFTTLNNIENL